MSVVEVVFVTLPLVLLQEQLTVVLLLEETLVSWSLAIFEHSGHDDLRDSGRQSVIPYVHGELYCIAQASMSQRLSFFRPLGSGVHLSLLYLKVG
jgi:hypothetical protein